MKLISVQFSACLCCVLCVTWTEMYNRDQRTISRFN